MPETLSFDDRPQTVEQKHELAQLIDRLAPGDDVTISCCDTARSLTVEREILEYDGTPDWTALCLAECDSGYVLSGYGTEYVLVADVESREPLLPRIQWPSLTHSELVMHVEIGDRGERIISDTTASDILDSYR